MLRWTGGSKARATVQRGLAPSSNTTSTGFQDAGDDHNQIGSIRHSDPAMRVSEGGINNVNRSNSGIRLGRNKAEGSSRIPRRARRSTRRPIGLTSSGGSSSRGVDCVALDWSVKAATELRSPRAETTTDAVGHESTTPPTLKDESTSEGNIADGGGTDKTHRVDVARQQGSKMPLPSSQHEGPPITTSSLFTGRGFPSSIISGGSRYIPCEESSGMRSGGILLPSQHNRDRSWFGVPNGTGSHPFVPRMSDDMYVDVLDVNFYHRTPFVPSYTFQAVPEESEWFVDESITAHSPNSDISVESPNGMPKDMTTCNIHHSRILPPHETMGAWATDSPRTSSGCVASGSPSFSLPAEARGGMSRWSSAWFGPLETVSSIIENAKEGPAPETEGKSSQTSLLDSCSDGCLQVLPVGDDRAVTVICPVSQESGRSREGSIDQRNAKTPSLMQGLDRTNRTGRRRQRRAINFAGDVPSARYSSFRQRSR